jgi:hypothetical protein
MSVNLTQIAPLTELELEEVAGGPLFLPLLGAFAKGALTGGTAAGLAVAVADALDLVDAF